jgi:DNA-binding beta-propeller fold protein YncE
MNRNVSGRYALGSSGLRRLLVVAGLGVASSMGMAPVQATLCGGANYPFPYTDVSGVGAAFCPGIMEAYVTGVSRGTSPTTFSPSDNVPRLQMTTFLQRSLDQGLKRTSRRAALNQWWTSQSNAVQTIFIGGAPAQCAADGENIWVSDAFNNVVIEVQASSSKVLGTWTGAIFAEGVLVAVGKVFVAGFNSPGDLYVIDPAQAPGAVATAASNLGVHPNGIAFDGSHIWTANSSGSVSIITPQPSPPYPVTTVTTGFTNPIGILYDGGNIWVTDLIAGKLFKLDAAGAIVQTVTVGPHPGIPVFDGANIWIPNFGNDSITVVQASTGNVVATIGADVNNQLSGPTAASFDGERVLVSNSGNDSVTVFKAADLSLIANVTTGASTTPNVACSDGINFWVPLRDSAMLLRF